MPPRLKSKSDREYFDEGYDITESGCWIWRSSPSVRYPAFMWNGTQLQVHHVSWLIYRGEITPGLNVCHNCPVGDNTRCVNPEHLWLGTQAENCADMARKNRHGAQRNPKEWVKKHNFKSCLPGELNPAHKLTLDAVKEIILLRDSGWSYGKLADKFNVSKSQISRICTGASWSGAI